MTRIFAAELGVAVSLRVVNDLKSLDARDYAGNPALSVPALETPTGVWFGALNVCRELARRSGLGRRVTWPEAFAQPLLTNAQDLCVQAMSTEVSLIMGSFAGATFAGVSQQKLQQRLEGCPALAGPASGGVARGVARA